MKIVYIIRLTHQLFFGIGGVWTQNFLFNDKEFHQLS